MAHKLDIPNWQIKYEIGIPDVDFQHQYFLELIKRFCEKINEGITDELIVDHLNEIVLYAQFHFCSEENLMKLHDYPGFVSHCKLHIDIIQELSDKINLYEIKELSLEELTSYLLEWFLDHTVKKDINFAQYLNKV